MCDVGCPPLPGGANLIIIFMSVGFGLAWITETSWPMNVGGLPTFAWWPNLIIIFELTMLGAILATVATLVVSALLPGKGRSLYDPAVTVEGKILVGVEDPPEGSVSDLERSLAWTPPPRRGREDAVKTV